MLLLEADDLLSESLRLEEIESRKIKKILFRKKLETRDTYEH